MDKFYYEHIGHMQFSTLTLAGFETLLDLSEGVGTDTPIPWNDAADRIAKSGFSKRLSESELERFAYGGCLKESYEGGRRSFFVTPILKMFANNLSDVAMRQRNQFSFLLRRARRKDYWNITVQESTFWNPDIYELTTKYRLRKGPARDFLKSMDSATLKEYITEVLRVLDRATHYWPIGMKACRELVEQHGKYWSGVGGKYSWFVFPQRFEIPDFHKDWSSYDNLVKTLIRPPEWGGGKTVDREQLLELFGEERMERFLIHAIVRPVYENGKAIRYQLTSPGYLQWERVVKGGVLEIWLERRDEDEYTFFLCDASDLSADVADFAWCPSVPTWKVEGTERLIHDRLSELLLSKDNQNRQQGFDFHEHDSRR